MQNRQPQTCLSEDSLEILQEILHYDGYLLIWFDRDIGFEPGSDLSASQFPYPVLLRHAVTNGLMKIAELPTGKTYS